MASLTGQLVAETYKALLKLIDNDILTASEKQITDGFGGGSNVFIDSQGFLRANKYKVTNGLATQFLKADGSLDSNAYLTSITGAQVITALGYTPVPTTRTITINGETHNLAADNSWTVGGTAAIWGNITGTLSNQTDLQNALNAKVPYTGATGNVNLGEYGITSGFVGFDTTPTGTPTGIGTMYWDAANRTVALIDGDGDTTLQIGQEERVLVHNNTGATLTDGQIVYVVGSTGELPSVALASNTAEATSSVTFGMVTESIAHGADGFITTSGIVHGLNTLALTEGSALWLGSTPGSFTQTKPVAPENSVLIGYVIKKAGGNGSVFVKIQNGYEIEELHDVLVTTPADNQALFLQTISGVQLWRNRTIADVLGYTPQAQLNGTGFVKISGTTISYDNSTYLSAADAASTYQRLDKMVSNLLPSATEYPNSNAVIAALALKADALNPVFTGYMTISGAEPKLYFTDTDQNPDYFIGADAGFFRIYDQTAGATRFVINSSGVTTIAGDLIVGTIAKSGGTASQFLKADGSIDSNSYVTSASLANYLLISTAASTYQRLDKMVSNLLPSDTEYPNSNAVLAKLALKADAANPVFTGNMTISGAEPKLFFVDTDQNPDYTVFIDSGFFYIYDQTVGATRFEINSSGNISTGVGKSITAGSFVKDGGTASQFLMADGSVSTFAGVTGSGTTNYIPKWSSASGIGNSQIFDNGTSVGFGTATPNRKLEVITGTGVTNGIRLTYAAGTVGEGMDITYLNTGATTTSFDSLYDSNDAVIRFRMKTATGSPVTALSILGSGVAVFANRVRINSAPDDADISLIVKAYSGTNKWIMFGRDSADLAVFQVASNGRVVVGQTNALTPSGFGYSPTSYPTLILGPTDTVGYRTLCIGVDVSGNPSGAFSGVGGEIVWRNTQTWITPNASNNGFNTLLSWNTGGSFTFFQNTVFSGNITINGANSSITNGNELRFYRPDNAIYTRMYDAGSLAANGFTFDNMNGEGFHFKNNGNTIMRMPSNGNVGIGTQSPQWMLELNKNTNSGSFGQYPAVSVNNPNAAGFSAYYFFSGATNKGGIEYSNSTNNLSIYGNGAERILINNVGNVAIGTTSAPGRLTVDYASYSSGQTPLYVGNTGYTAWNRQAYDTFVLQQDDVTSFRMVEKNGEVTTSDQVLSFSIGDGLGVIATSAQPLSFYVNGSPSGLAYQGLSGTHVLRLNTNGSANFFGSLNADSTISTGGNFVATSSGIAESRIRGGGYGTNYNTSLRSLVGAIGVLQFGNNADNYILVGNTAGGGYLDVRVNCSTESISAGSLALRIQSNAAAIFYSSVTATSFFESSDFRLKKLIEHNPIVAGIENLQAKLYEKNGKIELGYFAQDAELIMPYAVTKNEDGFLNLSYREVHTAKIARLEQRVAELEKQLNLN